MKKRILALLLAGVMIFSQSGAVLATENATAGGTDTETAAVAEPGQAEENAEEDEEPAVSVQDRCLKRRKNLQKRPRLHPKKRLSLCPKRS